MKIVTEQMMENKESDSFVVLGADTDQERKVNIVDYIEYNNETEEIQVKVFDLGSEEGVLIIVIQGKINQEMFMKGISLECLQVILEMFMQLKYTPEELFGIFPKVLTKENDMFMSKDFYTKYQSII